MSVVEIRKTKTRELQHSGWVQCRSEDPLTGTGPYDVCPCAPVCPVSVPAPSHVFLPVRTSQFCLTGTVPITDEYRVPCSSARIICTEETAESAFEHGGRLLPNL